MLYSSNTSLASHIYSLLYTLVIENEHVPSDQAMRNSVYASICTAERTLHSNSDNEELSLVVVYIATIYVLPVSCLGSYRCNEDTSSVPRDHC